MNIVFLQEGVTKSLVPILTAIENYPNFIVGCILVPTRYKNEHPPKWFTDAIYSQNPALTLFSKVDEGLFLGAMNAFLIIREPNTLLELNVLAGLNCFNFNGNVEGGRAGKKLLTLLVRRNIRTYPAEMGFPISTYPVQTLQERNELIKADLEELFGRLAQQWLPASWDVEPIFCY